MSSVSDKNSRENHNAFMFDSFPKIVEQFGTSGQAKDDNIIWRMWFACLMTKATGIHPDYVILLACSR